MPYDHLSHTSLSCLHFASSANVEGLLLRFLSRNFNVFSFIINPPQKSLQNCLYQRYNSAANINFSPLNMQLIGCIFRSENFFNILEFIYYVSFYSHVCTNYFWFVPSLTLFRTYLVQVYNIMRNVTTFLKVIFVHFSKDNETVSFIKLLDFGLSQGRVSAVSIKCVVICSKFITFAVTKTTLKFSSLPSCLNYLK